MIYAQKSAEMRDFYMGKKAKRKSNRRIPDEEFSKKPHRWDRIFGILTMATMIWFGLILYKDFKNDDTSIYAENTANKTQYNASNDKISISDNHSTQIQDSLMIKDNCVVCIDAGHGGGDKGTASGSYEESVICLLIAQSVQKELEHMGANVVMTRTSDTAMSQEQRVKIGNDKNADVFVSLHLNSSTNEAANGAEAWIHSSKPNNSFTLSKAILEEITAKTGIYNRNVKCGTLEDVQKNYYINSRSKSASLILELGFITNNKDMTIITSGIDSISNAIASGIGKYLNGGNEHESGKY